MIIVASLGVITPIINGREWLYIDVVFRGRSIFLNIMSNYRSYMLENPRPSAFGEAFNQCGLMQLKEDCHPHSISLRYHYHQAVLTGYLNS